MGKIVSPITSIHQTTRYKIIKLFLVLSIIIIVIMFNPIKVLFFLSFVKTRPSINTIFIVTFSAGSCARELGYRNELQLTPKNETTDDYLVQ